MTEDDIDDGLTPITTEDVYNALTTVVSTMPALFSNGDVVFVLETLERGLVAFQLDQEKIDNLRGQLDQAETFLREIFGHA